MYKNVIHPEFSRREEVSIRIITFLLQHHYDYYDYGTEQQVIDSYLERAKEVGVTSIKHVWFKSSEILNVAIISIFQMVIATSASIHSCDASSGNISLFFLKNL